MVTPILTIQARSLRTAQLTVRAPQWLVVMEDSQWWQTRQRPQHSSRSSRRTDRKQTVLIAHRCYDSWGKSWIATVTTRCSLTRLMLNRILLLSTAWGHWTRLKCSCRHSKRLLISPKKRSEISKRTKDQSIKLKMAIQVERNSPI